jgi:Holliday junction resolvasome RuvABC endonuclease subunit
MLKVLSLDISASSTGWAFYDGCEFEYGVIKTSPKNSRAERLSNFKMELEQLLTELAPAQVVIEDLYSGLNPRTLILLAKFVGVAEVCCLEHTDVDPYTISTNTVKSYFKAKKKENVFECVVSIFEWEDDELTFKKFNDMADALAQLICYYDKVLDEKQFRFEKDYGYFYEVKNGKKY